MSRPVLLHDADVVSDAALVARAASGDRWGREMLYRRHAGYLLGMTARLLGSRGDAEEIVQDTFVIGFERLGELRDPAAARGWLAQIAVNLVRRRIRRGRVLRLVGLDREAGDAKLEVLAAPGLDAEGRSELALFDRVLRRMRVELRIAWMLRRVEGLELTEVASLAGCSLATAKRRIAEAEALVRCHVGDARAHGAPGTKKTEVAS